MTINGDYVDWNVASQIDAPDSVLAYWRHMLAFRKKHTDLLTYGSYKPLSELDTGDMVLGYERESFETGKKAVVLLNFSDKEQVVHVESPGREEYEVLVSNQETGIKAGKVSLVPFGAVVLVSK
jgi:oligo-1,6-glucosidase